MAEQRAPIRVTMDPETAVGVTTGHLTVLQPGDPRTVVWEAVSPRRDLYLTTADSLLDPFTDNYYDMIDKFRHERDALRTAIDDQKTVIDNQNCQLDDAHVLIAQLEDQIRLLLLQQNRDPS